MVIKSLLKNIENVVPWNEFVTTKEAFLNSVINSLGLAVLISLYL